MPGVACCFFACCVPLAVALSSRLPVDWFLIPSLCFLLVFTLRRCDPRGVALYWAMLSVQFWGVVIVVLGCGAPFLSRSSSGRGAFLVGSFWLIWETQRFLQIELASSRRRHKMKISLVALTLSVVQLLILISP